MQVRARASGRAGQGWAAGMPRVGCPAVEDGGTAAKDRPCRSGLNKTHLSEGTMRDVHGACLRPGAPAEAPGARCQVRGPSGAGRWAGARFQGDASKARLQPRRQLPTLRARARGRGRQEGCNPCRNHPPVCARSPHGPPGQWKDSWGRGHLLPTQYLSQTMSGLAAASKTSRVVACWMMAWSSVAATWGRGQGGSLTDEEGEKGFRGRGAGSTQADDGWGPTDDGWGPTDVGWAPTDVG